MAISTADVKEYGAKIMRLKIVKWFLITVFGLLFLFAAAKIWRLFKKPPNAHYIKGGDKARDNFDPKPYAEKMKKVIGGVMTLANTKLNAAQDLYDNLNDNELIAVYNYWNDHIATTGTFSTYGTLLADMEAEWNVPDITVGGGTNGWFGLIDRMKALKLK